MAEYGQWAGRLQREGRLLGAEKLRGHALVLEAGGLASSGEGPQGYFLVRARSLEEARAIARGCPHLGHGGRVTLQVDGSSRVARLGRMAAHPLITNRNNVLGQAGIPLRSQLPVD